jgi:hypothetical protein
MIISETGTVSRNSGKQIKAFVLLPAILKAMVNDTCDSYRAFRAQADWTLTHTSRKDTEQSPIEASITLDGVTLTDALLRWSPNEWPSVCREIPVSADKMFWKSNKPAQWTPYRFLGQIIRLQLTRTLHGRMSHIYEAEKYSNKKNKSYLVIQTLAIRQCNSAYVYKLGATAR